MFFLCMPIMMNFAIKNMCGHYKFFFLNEIFFCEGKLSSIPCSMLLIREEVCVLRLKTNIKWVRLLILPSL